MVVLKDSASSADRAVEAGLKFPLGRKNFNIYIISNKLGLNLILVTLFQLQSHSGSMELQSHISCS